MECRSSLPIQMRANSMNDFEIRRARSDDAEAIADVHLDSRREAMPWLPVLHSREETVTYFTDVLLREDVLVAQADRIVVGFIAPSYAITSIIYISLQL